ncbi:MAG TPA: protein-L-isoaspartate(D-aspartate) O-methyltransferase [Vicinamibacterales bacterium]|nr:protein-L-isoaspartate(D-aspartate) O-methyltransferase [Vicinamibacterales bacterium]
MDPPARDDAFAARRDRMVDSQILARGISDARVLEAMRRVERHRFVPLDQRELAYGDYPIGIGFGQTISQPYIVAFMTEALALGPDSRVLEIGTGSAYQTAVLAEIARDVYSIEVVREHVARATELLRALGYSNVHVRHGDGYTGWPDAAPFDGIIVTAAPDHVPPPLVEQLRIGGRLVVPIGRGDQDLLVLTRTEDGLREEERLAVRFVPLVRSP